MKSPRHSTESVSLPVSRLAVILRQPTGEDDLVLRESRMPQQAMARTLAARLARTADGQPVDPDALCVADHQALLLRIRQAVAGDVIQAEVTCASNECRARVDITFRISEYLESHPVRTPRGLVRTGAGWFQLADEEARFRLPTVQDLRAIDGQRQPDRELARRCTEPAEIPPVLRRRMERAMESLAPPLSRSLAGECPECGGSVEVYFDVETFVVRELSDSAAGLYQDVHLLALHYKWPEHQILALPRNRRLQYVEVLRDQGGAV
jgi:hypothetical protein